MRTKTSLFAGVIFAALLAGCAGVDSRISKNQVEFDTYPPEIQGAIRNEKVRVGFTPKQVEIALGAPDRTYERTTANGTSEVWAYERVAPAVGFGLGFGAGTGPGSMGRIGTGVGIGSRYDTVEDRLRVLFENGVVSSVEELRGR